MKDIHPKEFPALFVDQETGKKYFSSTTVKSKTTEVVDDVEYQVFSVEVSSSSHPFYTGEKRMLDTTGRVDRFKSRAQKAGTRKSKTK